VEETLILRCEAEVMLFAIFDISRNLERLIAFIEGDDDGEEEEEAS
jgi:hypothetical protein